METRCSGFAVLDAASASQLFFLPLLLSEKPCVYMEIILSWSIL